MEITDLSLVQLQEMCALVAERVPCHISIMDRQGTVVASSLKKQLGLYHRGAAEVGSGQVDSFDVTAEMAEVSSVMLEGCNLPLTHDGIRIANVSITAPLKKARDFAMIASTCIEALLVSEKSQRKQRESEERFIDFADTAADWFWEMGADLRLTSFSDHRHVPTILNTDKFIGRTRWEIAGADMDNDEYWCEHRAKLESHEPFRNFQHQFTDSHNKHFFVSVSGNPVFDDDQIFQGYRGTTSDVTERRRLELLQQRRNSVLELLAKGQSLEEILKVLIEMSEELNPGMIGSVLLIDRDSKKLLHGAAPNLPVFYNEAIHGTRIGKGVGSCGTAAFTGETVIVDDVSTHPFWNKVRGLTSKAGIKACWSQPIFSPARKVLGTFAMYYKEKQKPNQSELDFIYDSANLAGIAIERKQGELELRHLRNYLSNIIDSMPSVLIGMDAAGQVSLWNSKAEHITGLSQSEVLEQPLSSVYPDLRTHTDTMLESLANKQVRTFSYSKTDSEGKTSYSETTVYPLVTQGNEGAVIRIDEVTDRVEMEQRLLQSQKMDAVGQLAGGIAHDFNNMLSGIIGAAELLRMKVRAEEQDLVKIIREASGRSAELIQKLLAFSRKESVSFTLVDMRTIIGDTIEILQRTLDKRIIIESRMHTESMTVMGDWSQLQNSLLNIGINAGHAMPKGGLLRFITDIIELDEMYCAKFSSDLSPGQYLQVAIRDTGCGIAKEHVKRIFEPFFTTRELNKGTGLGLSVVYGIIQQHHGAISVYSELNHGTEFNIVLPLTQGKAVKPGCHESLVTGEGCVLVIDDESVVRSTARMMLEKLGYTILEAKNGKEGVEVYQQHYHTIDLVVLDMLMPVMDGTECFEELKRINPEVRVIISSGFTRDADLSVQREKGLCDFIRKPYSMKELGLAVSRVLTTTDWV